jgi:hypothetical protein
MLRDTAACKSSTNYVYDFEGKNLHAPIYSKMANDRSLDFRIFAVRITENACALLEVAGVGFSWLRPLFIFAYACSGKFTPITPNSGTRSKREPSNS